MLKNAFLVCFFLLILAGCVSPRARINQVAVAPEVVKSETRFHKEYVWSPGDQLEVVVRRVPEVSRAVVIRPDGFITLPLINDVKAAGVTAAELKATLTTLFAERLADPEVTVIALQVPPPVVYVVGEVGNNLVVPLRSAPTAIQAITAAGGFRKSARTQDVSIIRLGEDGFIRAIPVVDEAGGQPGPVIGLRSALLESDDIVFVPESGRSQVARFLDDLINRPLGTLTGILGLYVNFRLIQVVADQ
jgi:polysaccharide export outer membrane protein